MAKTNITLLIKEKLVAAGKLKSVHEPLPTHYMCILAELRKMNVKLKNATPDQVAKATEICIRNKKIPHLVYWHLS